MADQNRYLWVTLALLLVLLVPTSWSLFGKHEVNIDAEEVADSTTTDSALPGRSPASASSEPTLAKTQVLALACEDSQQEVKVSRLRIKGSPCNLGWKNLKIKNQTNGFTASVIELANQGFTTDFVELSEGENKITVSGKDADGKMISKVMTVINHLRSPAAQKE